MNTPTFTASIQACGHQVAATVTVELTAIVTNITYRSAAKPVSRDPGISLGLFLWLCTGSDVREWPKCEVPRRPTWVRYWGLNGPNSDMCSYRGHYQGTCTARFLQTANYGIVWSAVGFITD